MKKLAIAILGFALLFSASSAQAETGKGGFVLMPFLESDFKPNFTVNLVSASYAMTNPAFDGVTASGTGLEIQLDCPWFQFGKNPLRQQMTFINFDLEGTQMFAFEINPHYFIPMGPLYISFGPGFGWLQNKDTLGHYFTLQGGAQVGIKMGDFNIAMESRHLAVTEQYANTLENNRTAIKIGYDF